MQLPACCDVQQPLCNTPLSSLACLAAATTASAVLNCEGAPARLLHLVADSDDADSMAKLVAQALAVVSPTTTPTFDEIKDVLNMVSCHLSSVISQLCWQLIHASLRQHGTPARESHMQAGCV